MADIDNKIVKVSNLRKLAQGLQDIFDNDLNEIINVIDSLDEVKADTAALEAVEAMFGGKALRYVTQEEYDALTDEEKLDENISWCIESTEEGSFATDEEKEYWNNKFDSNTMIDELSTEDKTIIGAINELESGVFDVAAEVTALETYKADKEYVDSKLEAISLNGYSLWVGTTEELEAIETRDENTLYFEIGEDSDELADTEIVNNVLTLTTDKYQKVEMLDATEIVLPAVSNFTEIHLYFSTTSELTLIFPAGKYQKTPVINANKTYEFIFTYIGEWLIGYVEYGN